MDGNNSINNLQRPAQFALFATSYIPLFFLIIVRQIMDNYKYLTWGGLSVDSIYVCVQKFGLSILSLFVVIFGLIGCKFLLYNLEKDSTNGDYVTLTKVNNRNSESIGYIATYVFPFLFQGFDGWYEFFAIPFLMVIIYGIYINSNMILINPLLSLRYSLFEIEYNDHNGVNRNGLMIIKNKQFCKEDVQVKIYEIGFKLFYGKTGNN